MRSKTQPLIFYGRLSFLRLGRLTTKHTCSFFFVSCAASRKHLFIGEPPLSVNWRLSSRSQPIRVRPSLKVNCMHTDVLRTKPLIYLDYQASAPVDPRVVSAMAPYSHRWAPIATLSWRIRITSKQAGSVL